MRSNFISFVFLSFTFNVINGFSTGRFADDFYLKRYYTIDDGEEQLVNQLRSLIRDFEVRSSWDSYVSGFISDGIAKAAILSRDGLIWSASSGIRMTPTEAKTIASQFENSAAAKTQGIVIGGVHYPVSSVDGHIIQGKLGDRGVVLARTSETILVGLYQPPTDADTAMEVIAHVADYLIESGY